MPELRNKLVDNMLEFIYLRVLEASMSLLASPLQTLSPRRDPPSHSQCVGDLPFGLSRRDVGRVA